MKRLIYNALSIEEGEGLSVLLLIVQSFFIGVFFQSFEISATALFMESYGKEMIGNAYLLSGLVGIILTAIYSKLQGNISFSTLSFLNLSFITLTTAALWYGFNVSSDNRIVFAAFLLMGPLYILSFVSFSGMVGRMFTLRQGKRLFSIVDSGLIFGILVISISIPFLLNIIPETKDLILISAASIVLSLIVQVIISFNFDLNAKEEDDASSKQKTDKKAGVKLFFTNKYVRLMSLFVMLSMVAAFVITYSFLAVTKINYPATKDFAGFLGKFIFAVTIFSLVIKTFVYSRLMKTYGLKVNLMILPVLLLFFATVTALSGTFFGYEGEGTASFLIFFLLTALVRFFAINLKDSIQTPSMKLLFQPIDKEIRYDIQAKVEGVINEVSAVLAGGLLAVLALIKFITNIHYSYMVVGIIAAWVIVTVRLYKEYQNTLRRSLVNYKKTEQSSSESSEHLPTANNDAEKMIYSLELTKRINPGKYEEELANLTNSSNQKLKEYALVNIQDYAIISAHQHVTDLLKNESNPVIRKLASETDNSLKNLLKFDQSATELSALARSKDRLEREKAAKIISITENEQYLPLLKVLLKDIEPNVKIAAFQAAAKEIYRELWPALVENLESPYYYSAARSAIIELGENSLELLEKSFYKSGISSETMTLITNIISHIDNERATSFLLDKISFTDRNVVLEALQGLSRINYEADDKSINKILQGIELNIGISTWNLSIMLDLKRASYNNALTVAMEEELQRSFNILFTMLSVAYDKLSIQHIRENIESGTTEAISFAIEMLDLFVAEQLKPILFPLLEDNKLENKIRELELHFPINRHDHIEVLYQIMNRSSNYVSHYTQACAIYTLLENKERKISNDLIANLFNPDPILKETAATVIYQIDPKVYQSCSERLHEETKIQLDKVLSLLPQKKSHLLIEKVLSYKDSPLLNKLSNDTIMQLALISKEATKDSNSILFSTEITQELPILFLLEGEAELKIDKKQVALFGPNDLVGDMLVQDNSLEVTITTTTKCRYYEIPKKGVYDIMFKDPDLITVLAKVIDKKIENENIAIN